MRRALPLASVLLAAAFLSCSTNTTHSTNANALVPMASAAAPAAASAAAPAGPLVGEHGFDVTGMDTSVKACDDFYTYAVGKWRESHPLDPHYSRFGRFEEVADRNRDKLKGILDADEKAKAPKGSATQKVGDFYAACMDEAGIEKAGLTPIKGYLDRINKINSREDLTAAIVYLHQQGFGPLFRVGGANDYKNSKMIIAQLGSGAIGLPDRDYYLREDTRFKDTRTKYAAHVAKMFVLVGEEAPAAQADAERTLQLETKLAAATLPRVEMRQPENTYHITTIADLRTMSPAIDWPAYLKTNGIDQATINVTQPKYIQSMSELLKDVALDDWKAYLRWTVIDETAATLPKALAEEDFNFRGRVLSGTKEQQERWKRCVRATDGNLGELLGQEYVAKYFTPQAKAKMNSLIDNLVSALKEDIPTLTWMGPETKQAALGKLAAFRRRIGYPDKWRDYSALTIGRESFAENSLATRRFNRNRNLARIGKPDDPNEWGGFTPPTVNASYNPTQNNITFPAGILQPPFYDPNADDAYNYGGIGTVIGHEMTHGFDDQGAKFDAEGNLRNWWTKEDLANFQQRADCIATTYSEFNVAPAKDNQPAININGKLVTGESIADLGGATLALRAYEKSLAGKERQNIDGFTPEQRFFFGFAQVWGENMAPEEATRRALTDPHAQGPFRVNGTVQNMPEFYKAFHCEEGQKMVREASKRCSIW
jgi:predicted metalloendopeptidase